MYACVMQHQPASKTATDELISITRLPKLAWASLALLTINLFIGTGIALTPSLQLDLYGHEVRSVRAASLKPSPFTEVVDVRKKKVHVAAKVRPVLAETPEMLDIPRVSSLYELDLPVRTQPVVYNSERDKKFVVIN